MDLSIIQDEELRSKLEEEFTKSVNERIEQEVQGLKQKNAELLGEKKTIQQKFEEINKKIDGLDIDQAKKILNETKKQQAKTLLDNGENEDYIKLEIQNRVSAIEKDYQIKLEVESEAKKQYLDKATKYESMYKDKMITDKIREAALKSGCYPTSAVLEDICIRGKNIFQLNDKENDVEARDNDGLYRKTDDGSKILTPELWLLELKKEAPHYFPPSETTGARGTSKTNNATDDLYEKMKMAAKSGDTAAYAKYREQWIKTRVK